MNKITFTHFRIYQPERKTDPSERGCTQITQKPSKKEISY